MQWVCQSDPDFIAGVADAIGTGLDEIREIRIHLPGATWLS
jgi:hypothetical protein